VIKLKKLYEGNVTKNFFVFAFPLVLTALFSQAYNIVNTIMVGYLMGDDAISAIGSTAPFISLISSLFWGYSTGFSVYVAVLFGRNDYPRMLNVIKINLLAVSLIAVLVSSLCIFFHENIFDYLNIEEAIRNEAFSYFSIYMAGLIFLSMTWSCMYISNAVGLTVIPLIASVMTNIINISGNYILIKYAGLGTKGAAVSTVFSAFCVSILYIFTLMRAFKNKGIKLKGIYIEKQDVKRSLAFGFPTMLQQMVMYLCTAMVSPLTNLCGASAISGYTIGMQLYDLNAGVYQNSNKTLSNYIAQCVGAGKASLIKKGIKTGLVQTVLFLIPFLSLTVFGSNIIAGVFLDSPDSIRYAHVFMRYCMPFVFFNVINNMFHAVFRSMGAAQFLVISTVIYSASRLGYSYLLYGKYEMYGIYAAIVLSWITEAIFGFIIYFSGKWKSREYEL